MCHCRVDLVLVVAFIIDHVGKDVKQLGRVGMALAALGLACDTHPSPPDAPDVAASLDLEQALVFIVQPGDTLSEIAQQCAIPGGAASLALWNGLDHVDRLGAGTMLLVPDDTVCARPLHPARLPRFDQKWTKCSIDWSPLEYDPYDGYGDLTPAEVDALEGSPEGGARLDEMRRKHRRCDDAGRGMTVCWKPWSAPGLEVRQGETVLFSDPDVSGHGGSGGDVPQLAWHDLDADGDLEFIVTQLIGWSNGISMPGSRILVFEDEHAAPHRDGGIFNHRDHWLENPQGGCDYLEIRFIRLWGPILGAGNYFAGIRHRWTGQDLATVEASFPAKRLLDRFFGEEGTALWDGESAFVWLLDGRAEARPIEELGG